MSRIAGLALVAVLMTLVAAFPARAQVQEPPKTPTAVGTGGSAATVDPLATQTAIEVLRSGGNAVDAAVAAAGVLGVTEPFSCGIGGGGFMVVYDAKHRKADTIDSREEAPQSLDENAFAQYTNDFQAARVSGLGVGVPGTVAGWELALKRYGSRSLRTLLKPGERIAREGFVTDATFAGQVKDNEGVFRDFTSSRETYLNPDGTAPPAGSVHRNPDMADTYRRIGNDPDRFYEGGIARDIARTVQQPPQTPGSTRVVAPGGMTVRDLERYRAIQRKPTKVDYRGLDVYGMGPPSSGGSTVGEALNIIEGFPRNEPVEAKLHHYLEASKLAYADRNEFVGDPDDPEVDVPLRGLLSDRFAAERRSLITDTALPAPQPPGDPWKYDGGHGHGWGKSAPDEQGRSTTHLTVADRWGNVVSYTFTIEQIAGSGIVVPDRGFLLNNELTDFNFVPDTANSPAGGKRPRSSMAPTIVLDHGRPTLALGSPGGATIITTVLQVLVHHVDFGMPLPQAIAEPRASQRNAASTPAEKAFIDRYGAALGPDGYGHTLTQATPNPPGEIGVVEAIRFGRWGRQQAAAEPTRRGGGSAMVVRPG